METIVTFIIAIVALAAGAAGGYYYKQYQLRKAQEDIQQQTERILADSQKKAREMEVAAKDKAIAIRQEAETETERKRAELRREDDRLQRRRVELDKNIERIEKREQTLNKRQSQVDRRANEIDKIYSDQLQKLEEVAAMSRDDARGILLAEVEKEARNDMARIIRQIEAEAKEEGDRRARDLIALAIQRVASEHVNEITTSTVPIPSEEMKGRIIGRNGRNIRAFEQAAGVDVIVDDTPEAVTISCFDPVRREVARRALGKLILDGRIHPAHIEKVLKKEQDEVERTIVEAGEQATYEAGVPGLPTEIIKILGRLKYRTSYGQNQLFHAVETARLSGVIASELGADIEIAKMGGLLHDLGKAIDHNVEGTHAGIGADLARRYRLPPKVINAIAAHHHEIEQESVEAIIVESADAISGARPGARRESLEDYIKRVRALEDIANSFKGVRESFALQAGREVRIIVKPEQVDDLDSVRIARDIAKQIEENMQYPGQIRVTVIRETRAVDYAK
ncbi:MAG: ribonuclease Y [Anaerolineales bacterium]|jgi:ribonuclease Y|nr:ribonuclease Y [Anaerolineales bacterium]